MGKFLCPNRNKEEAVELYGMAKRKREELCGTKGEINNFKLKKVQVL